jgi:RNA polymerase sigma-70 factor (ECF subfamily)
MILGNAADAEDAMQEVFVKAMKALESFRGDSSPTTWLYRISTNHCLNMIRSKKRLRLRLEQKANDPLPLTSVPAERMEAATLVRELLPLFDRRSQQMAIYCFVDGMSQEEIAIQVGASVPTVRKYLKAFVEKSNKHMKRQIKS